MCCPSYEPSYRHPYRVARLGPFRRPRNDPDERHVSIDQPSGGRYNSHCEPAIYEDVFGCAQGAVQVKRKFDVGVICIQTCAHLAYRP